jgi:hypothetical protein
MVALWVFACVHAAPAAAQHAMTEGSRFMIGAQGIGLLTRAAPANAGRTLTEGYLTQPMVMAMARLADGHVRLHATLDLEGLTLRRGEIPHHLHKILRQFPQFRPASAHNLRVRVGESRR